MDVGIASYRRLALYEMPSDIKIGMNLAFYRTFAIEPIGQLLARTAEITGQTRKRADDTGLFMYLLIYHGFDHPDAQAALRRLVRMHRRHEIANEHYLYVLACLMVVPTRWIARYGPRPLNEAEVESTYYFYRTLGECMGVRDIPATYHEVQVWFDGYDAEHLRPNAAGSRLMNASRGLLVDRFPTWARPLAARLSDAMLDPPLRQALGAEEPGWIARSTLLVVMRIRAFVARRRGPGSEPSFTPEGPVRSYPHGYEINMLGPADLDP